MLNNVVAFDAKSLAHVFVAFEGDKSNMFSSEEVSQTTEALEKLPRTFDHRSALNERRQHILQQKQTDALPILVPILLLPNGLGARWCNCVRRIAAYVLH